MQRFMHAVLALSVCGFMLAPLQPRQRFVPSDGFLVKAFGADNLFCGGGWTFPVLIDGHRPIGACILKTKQRNVFGGPFGF